MDLDDVADVLRRPVDAAALGAALEIGLFWAADEHPLEAKAVERTFGVPEPRAASWLRLLTSLGFLEATPRGFVPTTRCRTAILGTHSPATWALLAQEARENLGAFIDLPDALRDRSARRGAPSYVDRMRTDPDRARRFTRMLYELHQPLAMALAEALDLGGIERLMDLGGGSGVVSMALLSRWPQLTATVVDIELVCVAGRELAHESGYDERLAFHAADFACDPLPTGFDAVLECDVGVYSPALFAKVRLALDPGARFVIADEFAPPGGLAEGNRLRWAFERSLADLEFVPPELDTIRTWLAAASFRPTAGEIHHIGETAVLESIAV